MTLFSSFIEPHPLRRAADFMAGRAGAESINVATAAVAQLLAALYPNEGV